MNVKSLLALTLATAAWADFSPLDINTHGIGTVTLPLGARERAMGNSGLASTPQPGVSQGNPSRIAFQDKHSFSGTVETSLDYLHDDYTGNRRTDAFLPGLTLAFPTRKYGALAAWYWQTSHRNFSFSDESSNLNADETQRAEGGLFELGASYSYAILPQLAVGLDIRKILGQERFIGLGNFNEDSQDPVYVNSRGVSDTVRRSLDGLRGGFSATLRQKKWNLALAIQSGTTLDVTTSRHITGILTDARSSSELYLPWQGLLAAALKPKLGHTVTLDANYAAWGEDQGEGVNPGFGVGAGYEYQGMASGYDAYWKKCAVRVGGGYESLYLENSWQGFATVGLGFPLGARGHALDISLQSGHRELGGNSFLVEDYLKLTVTVQGVGVWGQPLRRRR